MSREIAKDFKVGSNASGYIDLHPGIVGRGSDRSDGIKVASEGTRDLGAGATTRLAHGGKLMQNDKTETGCPKNQPRSTPDRNQEEGRSSKNSTNYTSSSNDTMHDCSTGEPTADTEPSANTRTPRRNRRPPSLGTSPPTELKARDGSTVEDSSATGEASAVVSHENGAASAGLTSHRSSKRLRRSAASSYSLQSRTSNDHIIEPHSSLVGTAHRPVSEADVMILSSLDDKSYERAMLRDSNTYMNKVLFPMNFPWHNAREPLLRTIPNDIDELDAILFADNDFASTRDDSEGPIPDLFGYGKCEIGQERQQGKIPSFTMGGYDTIVASARRSNDPGQIELAASMPPPPSLPAALVSSCRGSVRTSSTSRIEDAGAQAIGKMKATVEAERAETSRCMPMFCRSVDGNRYFNPPAFAREGGEYDDAFDNINEVSDSESELAYADIYQRDHIIKKRKELARACARKWKVSIKVGGSSTRSRLFSHKEWNSNGVTRTLSRPMLRTATLPAAVASGNIVSAGVAATMDRRGYAQNLGSYDTRRTQGKKNVVLGRTRLIWTSKADKSEGASKYNSKVSYTSIVTGQKLETNAHKRPREVRVGVRLNGNLISEKVRDQLDGVATPVSAGKKSSRKSKQTETLESLPSPVPAKDAWNKGDIDRAVGSAVSLESERQAEKTARPSSCSPPRIRIVESSELITNAASQIKQRQNQASRNGDKTKPEATEDDSIEYVSMKHGASLALKHVSPRFVLLPLDDGLLRVVCSVPGTMQATSVHKMLHAAAERGNGGRLCSVCWSSSGEGESGVQECADCGLLVHLACCRSKGEFVQVFNDRSEPSNPGASSTKDTNPTRGVDASHFDLHWRCAICQTTSYSSRGFRSEERDEESIAAKKPRRSSKLPARFNDGQTNVPVSTVVSGRSRLSLHRPSPQCSLCPHSGGAMSMLGEGSNLIEHRWTHEVCRVWCQRTAIASTPPPPPSCNVAPFDSPNSNLICVLCGTGGRVDTPLSNAANDGNATACSDATDKEEVGATTSAGLIKCAAKGCFTFFHPMCAILATKMLARPSISVRVSDLPTKDKPSSRKKKDNGELQAKKKADEHLCKKYTLTLVESSAVSNSDISSTCIGSSVSSSSAIIPIAFCGLHNPERDEDMYGYLPGGNVMD